MTTLLQMYDRCVKGAGKGKYSGLVLLDLSAAFDLVNSDILLEKLKIYGLDDEFLLWMRDYLTDRKQAVWIDHTLSSWLPVNIGVPQGSILGPLLFVIFTNDLPYSLSCDLDMYADDSTLTSCGTMQEVNLSLNINCDKVSSWMTENEQCLNASKTHFLIAGTNQRLQKINQEDKSQVSMDGHVLVESEDMKETLLGVTIQPDLKWAGHIGQLQKKVKG